ncbi:hypothetical protein [Cellulomonas sp. ICMP 17802]|uniref:hypothetical protein n=1 Tax=Cellulomonas sp. ICMP 17802 TaxID=3239199 RepID=UPI00351B508E
MRAGRVLVAVASAAVLTGCVTVNEQAGPGMMHGRGATVVRSTCAPPVDASGSTVVVMLGDGGMMRRMHGGTAMLRAVPATVPAGPVTLLAQNMGRRTHELVVLPLAPGESVGERAVGVDGTVDETGSLGEASAPCAEGAGDGLTPGAVGWVTLDLPAGRYELVCNLPRHYAAGMVDELVVTAR